MHWIPYEKFRIETNLDRKKITEKLREVTEKPSIYIHFFLPSSSNPKTFLGSIIDDHFKIWRYIRYRNSFLPITEGKIDGSTIHITMRLQYFVAGFMTIWFSGVLFAFVTLSMILEDKTQVLFLPDWGAAIALIFGYLLVTLPFHFEAEKAKRILKEMFEKRLEEKV